MMILHCNKHEPLIHNCTGVQCLLLFLCSCGPNFLALALGLSGLGLDLVALALILALNALAYHKIQGHPLLFKI